MFQTADGGGIPIHIAVVAVARGIYQQVQYNEHQQRPGPVLVACLAERKPKYRHEEKREMKTQQL